MEYFPAPLEKLVEQFARLPGVGYKSAQRLAFHVLSLPAEEAQAFADAIVDAKRSVTLLPCVPEPHRRRPVPYLRRPEAGRRHHLRGGRSPRRDRHRAQPGVPGALPCAPRRAVPHEPCGAR